MENEENKNTKKRVKKLKGKNFYIALGICLISVAAAAFSTYKSVNYMINEPISSENTKAKTSEEENLQENEPKLDTKQVDTKPEKKEKEQEQEKKNKEETQTKNSVVYPVSKEVTKKFSNNTPVYFKTMKDWRVHNAIDLKAERGAKVKSILPGKVKNIKNDEFFGMTITIEHDNGITAEYSGLANTVFVKINDRVTTGQEIGSINDVPCESSEGYHLHLVTKRNNKSIDPLEILTK